MVPVRTLRLTPAFAVTPGKDFQTSDSSTANVESLVEEGAWFIKQDSVCENAIAAPTWIFRADAAKRCS